MFQPKQAQAPSLEALKGSLSVAFKSVIYRKDVGMLCSTLLVGCAESSQTAALKAAGKEENRPSAAITCSPSEYRRLWEIAEDSNTIRRNQKIEARRIELKNARFHFPNAKISRFGSDIAGPNCILICAANEEANYRNAILISDPDNLLGESSHWEMDRVGAIDARSLDSGELMLERFTPQK